MLGLKGKQLFLFMVCLRVVMMRKVLAYLVLPYVDQSNNRSTLCGSRLCNIVSRLVLMELLGDRPLYTVMRSFLSQLSSRGQTISYTTETVVNGVCACVEMKNTVHLCELTKE